MMPDREQPDTAVRWLKVSYIAGAVADGLVGILMLIPYWVVEEEFRFSMGFGASSMFGWMALLLWAYQEPQERKGILLLTIFPVIGGLVATQIWALAADQVSVQRGLPPLIGSSALALLMGFSYWKASATENRDVG